MVDGKRLRDRVAVIGLGVTGVAVVKNLLETGFVVVGFERNESLGGLWRWRRDPTQTSVLKSTRANIIQQLNSYHDFPFPADTPSYPSANQMADYIDQYADHFNLREHFRLGVRIERIERSSDKSQWILRAVDESSNVTEERFDKVVVSTGPFAKSFIPRVDGAGHFEGTILHSQAFKDPHDFKGKRVVIVGLSNTGADIAVELHGIADKIYVSFRAGARIIRRSSETTLKLTRRITSFGTALNSMFPRISSILGAFAVERMMRASKPQIKASWGLLPAPPISNAPPVANEFITSFFADGSVIPCRGIRRFLPPSSVELADGTILESIDAVIFATGYRSDFSILAPEADPTLTPTPEWDAISNGNTAEMPFPRLYQGIFHTEHPQSLAFIGPYSGHSFNAFSNADLNGQALAQVWAGNYALPPPAEMERWCDEAYRAALKKISVWRVFKLGTDPRKLGHWLNDAAGNELNERLGWGREGWMFWWKERELYKLIMDGVNTPFVYKLFEGSRGEGRSRKKWLGAREAIYKANGKKLS